MENGIKILCVLALIVCVSCKRAVDSTRVVKIGKDLVQLDTNTVDPGIPNVVYIGEGLQKKLRELKSKATQYSYKIDFGDFEKPLGNGEADCILTIDSDAGDIGIRLKLNEQKNKYDILGWMTLSEN